jgi:hypothetical protein
MLVLAKKATYCDLYSVPLALPAGSEQFDYACRHNVFIKPVTSQAVVGTPAKFRSVWCAPQCCARVGVTVHRALEPEVKVHSYRATLL